MTLIVVTPKLYIKNSVLQYYVSLNMVNKDVSGVCGPAASLADGSITLVEMSQEAKMDYWQEHRDESSRSMPSTWNGKRSESTSSLPGCFDISIAKFSLPVTRILVGLSTTTFWQLWYWAIGSEVVYSIHLRISKVFTWHTSQTQGPFKCFILILYLFVC